MKKTLVTAAFTTALVGIAPQATGAPQPADSLVESVTTPCFSPAAHLGMPNLLSGIGILGTAAITNPSAQNCPPAPAAP